MNLTIDAPATTPTEKAATTPPPASQAPEKKRVVIEMGTPVIEEGTPTLKVQKGGNPGKYKKFIDAALKLVPPQYYRIPLSDETNEKTALIRIKNAVRNAGAKDALNVGIATNGGIVLVRK